jgi:hypothetical protein
MPAGDDRCPDVADDRRLDKQAIRQRGRELRTLLVEWDPIGVMGPDGAPEDEYDCMLWPLMRLLEAGGSATDLSQHLMNELQEHFGQPTEPRDVEPFASRAKAWFDDKWAGSRV